MRDVVRQNDPRLLGVRKYLDIGREGVRIVHSADAHETAAVEAAAEMAPDIGATVLAEPRCVARTLEVGGGRIAAEHLQRVGLHDRVHHERTAGDALALPAMTGMCDDRFCGEPEAHLAAGTSAIARYANGAVWMLWEPAVFGLFLLVGSLWCTVCPLSSAGRAIQRRFSSQIVNGPLWARVPLNW